MNRIRIVHTTGFEYSEAVNTSYNEARMLPRSGGNQFVLMANLDIHPVSAQHTYTDYWGTTVSAFEILIPHTRLSLTATSLVEVATPLPEDISISWQELALASKATVETVEQLVQTDRTDPPRDVASQARKIADKHTDAHEAALEITRFVGSNMEYTKGVTGVQSVAKEAWKVRKGVCQDISHVTLGALRSVGIPARYVSGYLHPTPSPIIGETVACESHAWVEFFCGQWVGFDPTNLIEIGDRHVRVGHGRDYSDAAPLRGVYSGGEGQELFVSVEITREA